MDNMQYILIVCKNIVELKLVDDETGLPNDQLNIGGYRSAKIWKPKSRLYGKPTDGGETPPPGMSIPLTSFKDSYRELTDLNWDGSESEKIDRE